MNRRDRRAQAAANRQHGAAWAKNGKAPEGYEETCQAMLHFLLRWLASGMAPPRFALPPKEIALLASLDHMASRIARNDSARQIINGFCVLGDSIAGEPPTVLQLGAVLEIARVEVERVSLAELGLVDGGRSN